MPINAQTQMTQVSLVALTLGGSGPATGVDITGFTGVLEVKLGIATVTGSSPTMVVAIETSDTLGSGYVAAKQVNATTATFASKNAAGIDRMLLDAANLKRYVRINATLGGSSPSFPTVVTLTGFKSA